MNKKNKKKYKDYSPQFVVDESGKKSMVLLKLEVFENLLEDLHDLALVAERRDDKRTSYEDFRKKLKQQGKI